MRLTAVIVFLFFTLVQSQQFFGSNLFAGGLDVPSGVRDPRQNRGPVTFPQSPADNGETSGVIPGASGYGFVPPSAQQGFLGQGLQRFY